MIAVAWVAWSVVWLAGVIAISALVDDILTVMLVGGAWGALWSFALPLHWR